MSALLSVADAQAALLALAPPPRAETLPLLSAAGRFVLGAVTARRDQPERALSAMDGYAIAHQGTVRAWQVVGEVPAGSLPRFVVGPGEAARIFTGAPLPAGTDTVVMQEDVARHGDLITLTAALPANGAHVRGTASDFADGSDLLCTGTMVTPGAIALAAMGGHDRLTVGARPRVALLSTGDELLPIGAPPLPGRIPASNAPMLAAQLGALGVVADDLGIAPDTLTGLSERITAARNHDVLVTTGGASVGDYDLVLPALRALGAEVRFWKVALKPGKPLMVAKLGETIVLGLPGNPASAFVTAHLFLLPLVRAIMGADDPMPTMGYAKSAVDLPPGGDRALYVRARLAGGQITAAGSQDSGRTHALAHANALLIRDVRAAPVAAGGLVPYHPM